MTKTKRKQYEAVLASNEAELAARLGNRDGIEIEKTADPMDEVQSAGERELEIRNLHGESKTLGEVRSALIRIARKRYGACLHREAEINVKRRTAVPWTNSCIERPEATDHHEFDTTTDFGGLLAEVA
jgi:DnaK suppressor protein